MSFVDDDIVNECGNCDGRCFEPKACAACIIMQKDHTLLCTDCRRECKDCGEQFCLDHWDDDAKLCTSCATDREIASGEALAAWKWSGGY